MKKILSKKIASVLEANGFKPPFKMKIKQASVLDNLNDWFLDESLENKIHTSIALAMRIMYNIFSPIKKRVSVVMKKNGKARTKIFLKVFVGLLRVVIVAF